MDAIPGIAAHIAQICTDGADEVFVGIVLLTDITRHDGLNGGSQRRAISMISTRSVVIVIDPYLFVGEITSEKILEHENVWLFEYLGLVAAFNAKESLRRNFAWLQ